MHFRLHDVDATGTTVGVGVTFKVMHRTQHREDAIQNAFRHFVAVFIQNRFVGHQVADVTNKQQRATRQSQFRTVGCSVFAIGIQGTSEGLTVLSDLLRQITRHQA